MKIENWCGHDIRFVKINGEWWAILKDICDALGLRTDKVAYRLEPSMLERIPIEKDRKRPTVYNKENYDHPSKGVVNSSTTFWMLAVNELGIYEALFTSHKLEARKFRMWAGSIMQKLRSRVGLEQYEVMRITEPEIQENINHILDTLFYDEETKTLMASVTVAGGDVEQIPFEF